MAGLAGDRTDNLLLAALPQRVYQRLRPSLETVTLNYWEVLHERNQPIDHVYFPCDRTVLSVLVVMEDGASLEVAMVGREGLAGLSAFLGHDTVPSRTLVQGGGEALRMQAEVFRAAASKAGPFNQLVQRYANAYLANLLQSAACNRFHCVEQRCVRWLLRMRDLVRLDQFAMTQEVFAKLLGVRRTGVSEVTGQLEKKGFIRWSRGQVTILDLQGMKNAACECYGIIQEALDRSAGSA